ncbi:acyl-CoA synthetase (AMP-forming)/AMP-acid ligase II [Breoghania corrubedonensis]|uniref:Acyl-CoA synthetase (AMP-forming)/AMP-acid ligase II n=1 Tax=Breoghania corrubedonensis TaxID=665038 RepID=A0A2T5VC92_9HYPH|nr:acyl-CoA synthetase [Breoghania corrubedonensis]PTW61367.1 acyl-CoA synthetase (AMP-forming)/AMP-acid ligase II [Breoghania corrubedonensis]
MSAFDFDPDFGPSSVKVANLAHFVTRAARRQRDKPAFVFGEAVWTWSEFETRIDAMAQALRDRFDIAKGDRVLVQSQNCNQMFESMFACFRLGAVWVPTNFRQTPDEVAYLAEASGAKGMICGAEFPDHVAACLALATPPQFVISIGGSDFGEEYDDLVSAHLGARVPDAPVERDHPCWFFFTSGTTGRPKAAVLTHGQMSYVVTNHLCDLMPGLTEHDRSIVVAPLSHGAGVHQLTQVAAGVATILPGSPNFDVAEVWRLVERWRVSTMFTVPTIVKRLIEHPAVDEFDRSSMRYIIYAGAPMYREDQKRALVKLGPVLVQYYGLGEVTGNITCLPAHAHTLGDTPAARPGTCGYERTGMEVSIQADDGTILAPGETGEICVIGPGVFAGYYRNPEANAKAFRNGWFRTGDLGHLDEEGYLFITGRASDMYISGGSNIYPREIEEKILLHPGLSEVAVLGIPDPQWGEVGIAVCVAKPGANVSEDEIAALLAAKVSRYKIPKQIFFLEEMPKSAYGKITKKLVRETLEARGLLRLSEEA